MANMSNDHLNELLPELLEALLNDLDDDELLDVTSRVEEIFNERRRCEIEEDAVSDL